MKTNKLSRKDLADLIGVDVSTVGRNEIKWGINIYATKVTPKLIWYEEIPTLNQLRKCRRIR